jgi:hypothetical protein
MTIECNTTTELDMNTLVSRGEQFPLDQLESRLTTEIAYP